MKSGNTSYKSSHTIIRPTSWYKWQVAVSSCRLVRMYHVVLNTLEAKIKLRSKYRHIASTSPARLQYKPNTPWKCLQARNTKTPREKHVKRKDNQNSQKICNARRKSYFMLCPPWKNPNFASQFDHPSHSAWQSKDDAGSPRVGFSSRDQEQEARYYVSKWTLIY